MEGTGTDRTDGTATADAYLVALLPDELHGAARESLVTALEGSDGSDPLEPLRAARAVVASRVRIDPVLDVHLLHDELGVALPDIATLLGVDPSVVVAHLADARALLGEPPPAALGPAPAVVIDDLAPDDEPPAAVGAATPMVARARPAPDAGRGGRTAWVLSAAVVAVVVVLAALAGGQVAGDCDGDVCVREAVVTSGVDANGAPLDDRAELALDEQVSFWLRYDVGGQVAPELTVVWRREGEELYQRRFALPAADRVVVRLDPAFAAEPGAYSVEVRGDDGPVAQADFVLTAPTG
ncbi:MAG: hypothetical protein ACLGIR_06320 [Actinomycetes bacterium]